MVRTVAMLALALGAPAFADCPAGGVAAETVAAGARYKIVGVSAEDAFYSDRGMLIGQVGAFEAVDGVDGCWVGGRFTSDAGSWYFSQVEVVPTTGAPAPMPIPVPITGLGSAGCPPGAAPTVPKGSRATILHIHPEDAYSSTRSQYEGRSGTATDLYVADGCYMSGDFQLDPTPMDPYGSTLYFYKVAVSLGGTTDWTPKLATGAGCPEGAYAGPVWPGQRVQVLAIGSGDAWYPDRDGIVGSSGEVQLSLDGTGCWLQGSVRGDDGLYRFFHEVAVGKGGVRELPRLKAATLKNAIAEGTRVQLVDLYYQDGLSHRRDRLVGKECTVVEGDLVETGSSWLGGHLQCGGETYSFFRIRVAEL